MATEVYSVDEIKLQDGTEVSLKPLPINRLRKFMKRWNEFGAALDERQGKITEDEASDLQFDTFIDLSAISLEATLRKDDESEEDFKERLGDVLDELTIYRILEKCGGLKLNDPNLLAAAAVTQMSTASAGTN